MVSLFRKLFTSNEVKVLLHAYEDETLRISSIEQGLLGPSIGLKLIDVEVRESIDRSSKEIVEMMRRGDRSPRVLALVLIGKIASNFAACGRYHTYRGMLSMQGIEPFPRHQTQTGVRR